MTKQFIISLLVISCLSLTAQPQDKQEQKYKSISKRKLSLDQSVPSLLREAEALMAQNPKGALRKVEEALALSITQKSTFNEASCYIQLGKINEQIGEWELAIENYQNAQQRLDNNYQQTPEYQQTLEGLARSYEQLGQYQQALPYLQQQKEASPQPKQRARAQLDIANNYYQQNRIEEAATNIEEAEESIEEIEDLSLQNRANAIKSKILVQSDELEAAQELYEEVVEYELEGESQWSASEELDLEESKEELINAYQKQNKVEEEIELRTQYIATNTTKGKPLKVVKEKQKLSKRYLELGRTRAGINELEDAAQLADSLNNYEELSKSYLALARAWDELGDSRQSIEYFNRYSTTMDSVKQKLLSSSAQKESLLKQQQDILTLTKELALDESEYELEQTSRTLRYNQLKLQQFVIYGLLGTLLLTMLAAWLIYRNAKKSHTRGQLLALKSLRSQMNPHFIFNALNSVNQFIALNDERAANKFISEFSKLMRLVLDNSRLDFITLAEEKEILSLYLKLEHKRFSDQFDYEFIIDEDLALDTIEVPPMLIQPYIENAIWHGLRYKEEKGMLKVHLQWVNETLQVKVEDDGIGRKRSQEIKTKHQKNHHSTGLKNTEERIAIINKVYGKRFQVHVSDANPDGSGTHVQLILPLNGKH